MTPIEQGYRAIVVVMLVPGTHSRTWTAKYVNRRGGLVVVRFNLEVGQ